MTGFVWLSAAPFHTSRRPVNLADSTGSGRLSGAIWVLSEAIGALALTYRWVYCLNHICCVIATRICAETLLTLVITLALSWLAMRYIPWPFTVGIVLLMGGARG